jgi:hypothetical protein
LDVLVSERLLALFLLVLLLLLLQQGFEPFLQCLWIYIQIAKQK